MKFLLDTHVLLWSIDQPELLSRRVKKALLDEANDLVASTASTWEITLKLQSGKLTLPAGEGFLERHLRSLGLQSYLPITASHVYQAAQLPLVHKDPFDRMLVAQAIVEGFTLVSKDQMLRKYPVPVLW